MATLLIMALKEESQQLFEDNHITPHYCGVGQVKAAYFTHKLILEHKPRRIVNLGTAGSHRLPQGSLVECTSFVQRPANGFFLIPSATLLVEPVTGLPAACCGTADFVSMETPTEISRKKTLAEYDVMDMEAYAIAYVCRQLQVPFTCLKYVSDSSDAATVTDWKRSLRPAAESLLREYRKIISEEQVG